MATIADLAVLVRSKNAGPFWLTIDIMFDDEGKYRRVRDSAMITPVRMPGVPYGNKWSRTTCHCVAPHA